MSVAVAGSLNMDLVMRVPRMPAAGETLTGDSFIQSGGGKGANQAIACARLGARVCMIGCIGADAFGRTLHDSLTADGIDTFFLATTADVPTGVAMILVDGSGENRIVLAPGANAHLLPAQIDAAGALIRARAC